MLSERLKELEAEGVLLRTVEPGPPVRVADGLTAKGQGLSHVVEAPGQWAERWVVLHKTHARNRGSRGRVALLK